MRFLAVSRSGFDEYGSGFTRKKVLKNEKCKEVGDNWQLIPVQFLVFTVMGFILLSFLFVFFNSRKLFIRLFFTNLLKLKLYPDPH